MTQWSSEDGLDGKMEYKKDLLGDSTNYIHDALDYNDLDVREMHPSPYGGISPDGAKSGRSCVFHTSGKGWRSHCHGRPSQHETASAARSLMRYSL